MSIDRRKHPRRPLALRVRWHVVESGRGTPATAIERDRCEESMTLDTSDGGLAFHAGAPLPVDASLAIELEREPAGPPLSALGRVARCAADGARWRIGVELTWIEELRTDVDVGLHPENAWLLG